MLLADQGVVLSRLLVQRTVEISGNMIQEEAVTFRHRLHQPSILAWMSTPSTSSDQAIFLLLAC